MLYILKKHKHTEVWTAVMTITTIVGQLVFVVAYIPRLVFSTTTTTTTRSYPKVMNALFVRSRLKHNNNSNKLLHHFAFVSTPKSIQNCKFHCSSSYYHTIQHNSCLLQMNSNNNNDDSTNNIKNIDMVITNTTTVQIQKRTRSNSINSDSTDDSNKRIQLPILKYGYRTVPFTWDELVQIITIEINLDKLTRSIEQQKIYEVYKRDLLLEWTTITDHLLCTKFTTSTASGSNVFEKKINPITNLAYAYPSINDNTIVIKIILQNDFPYYIENNIEHWILWKLCESCTDNDIEQAKNQLCTERSFIDIIHWTNPIHLKSIPSIDHVHILGKTTSNASNPSSNITSTNN